VEWELYRLTQRHAFQMVCRKFHFSVINLYASYWQQTPKKLYTEENKHRSQ